MFVKVNHFIIVEMFTIQTVCLIRLWARILLMRFLLLAAMVVMPGDMVVTVRVGQEAVNSTALS